MEVNGRVTSVFQECTWDEEEESMTGLVCSLGRKYFCTLTAKPTAGKDIQSTPRRAVPVDYIYFYKGGIVCVGTICTHQSNNRSRTRKGREIGSKLDHILSKETGEEMCAVTDKTFEETEEEGWEGVMTKIV